MPAGNGGIVLQERTIAGAVHRRGSGSGTECVLSMRRSIRLAAQLSNVVTSSLQAKDCTRIMWEHAASRCPNTVHNGLCVSAHLHHCDPCSPCGWSRGCLNKLPVQLQAQQSLARGPREGVPTTLAGAVQDLRVVQCHASGLQGS